MTDDLHTLIARYLDEAAGRGVADSTLNGYRTGLKKFEAFVGERSISRPTLRAYLRHLQADPRIRPTTVESYWQIAGTFCAWLVKSGVMEAAPPIARGLSLPRHVPAGDDVSSDARAAVPGSAQDLVEQFLDARRAKGLAEKTIQHYMERLGWFVDWLGERPITRQTLRAYVLSLQQRERPLAASSIAAYFRDIKTMLAWAKEEGLIDSNPAVGLVPRVPKQRIASYSIGQIAQLLATCDARDQALIIMLLDTGLRASEVCRLRRDAIDPETGRFEVVGKGAKPRAGWCSPYTLELLAHYLAQRTDANPWLWPARYDQPLTRNGLYQAIRRAAVRAGIRGEVRRLVHSMRATFAKHYVQQGGDLESLRRLLGHASLTMSAAYAELDDTELAAKKAQVNPLAWVIAAAADAR